MPRNVSQKLIDRHLQEGKPEPGHRISIDIDQTLTQDATGTLVMLEFEATGLKKVRTKLSAQYVDHNLLQADEKNADDHLFLASACGKYGVWFSKPGNGVSHVVHMEHFSVPGASLLGSDSHTCAGGSMGMLAIGAGGMEVAMAMSGAPYHFNMPVIMGVELQGELPDWVSSKDVILEMLRRHGVKMGTGKIIEYHGPGLESMTAMDRHVIANMGAELGATTSVFPADDRVKEFMQQQNRGDDFIPLSADPGASYDEHETIDLSRLEPLIACPSSPGNVVPVGEVAGKKITQAYIGSSSNPGLRDFATAALMVDDNPVHTEVSFDVNPASRQVLENLVKLGLFGKLVHAGARIHQTGCNGCIGMGQAPASGQISLRTVPRNFPGRSGNRDDEVYLCSPETATASALKGVITDPRTLQFNYPRFQEPDDIIINRNLLVAPEDGNDDVELVKGPNIKSLPGFSPVDEKLEGRVLLKVEDNISTDEILPAGADVLPYRSNIPGIARFAFAAIDDTYYERCREQDHGAHFLIAGENYGQGSSREHAALAPRYLGLQAVIAKGYARIHKQNLVNYAILPLKFLNDKNYDEISLDDELEINDIRRELESGSTRVTVMNHTRNKSFETECELNDRETEIFLAGGLINYFRDCGNI